MLAFVSFCPLSATRSHTEPGSGPWAALTVCTPTSTRDSRMVRGKHPFRRPVAGHPMPCPDRLPSRGSPGPRQPPPHPPHTCHVLSLPLSALSSWPHPFWACPGRVENASTSVSCVVSLATQLGLACQDAFPGAPLAVVGWVGTLFPASQFTHQSPSLSLCSCLAAWHPETWTSSWADTSPRSSPCLRDTLCSSQHDFLLALQNASPNPTLLHLPLQPHFGGRILLPPTLPRDLVELEAGRAPPASVFSVSVASWCSVTPCTPQERGRAASPSA